MTALLAPVLGLAAILIERKYVTPAIAERAGEDAVVVSGLEPAVEGAA
jgi:hypothetical protein